MTLKELKEIEDEIVYDLRVRSQSGDNDAAHVLLTHLRETSRRIAEWQRDQPPRTKKEKE